MSIYQFPLSDEISYSYHKELNWRISLDCCEEEIVRRRKKHGR